MSAQVWVQALSLGGMLAALGWGVAAGPLRIFGRASRDVVVFNALAWVASLAWWPFSGLDMLPPAYRLTLGLMAWLAGIQWFSLGLHKLYDFKPTYAVSPFMLPFVGAVMAAVAWMDGSGQGSQMAACGVSLWMLGVTVQQGYAALSAVAGGAAARWALLPLGLTCLVWLAGMGWSGWLMVTPASASGNTSAHLWSGTDVAAILGVPSALVWLLSWALLNGGMLALVMLKLVDKIRELSTEDDLTGAMNMRTFLALLNAERERIRRNPQIQTVLVGVIDQHEGLNRQLGFAAGDAALRHVTGIIGRGLRKTDRLASSMQGELLLFLPATPAVGATLVAERTQAAIKSNPLLWRGQAINLTLSIGLASWEDGTTTSEHLLELATQAVQRARREGGARIRLASSDAFSGTSVSAPPQKEMASVAGNAGTA